MESRFIIEILRLKEKQELKKKAEKKGIRHFIKLQKKQELIK